MRIKSLACSVLNDKLTVSKTTPDLPPPTPAAYHATLMQIHPSSHSSLMPLLLSDLPFPCISKSCCPCLQNILSKESLYTLHIRKLRPREGEYNASTVSTTSVPRTLCFCLLHGGARGSGTFMLEQLVGAPFPPIYKVNIILIMFFPLLTL